MPAFPNVTWIVVAAVVLYLLYLAVKVAEHVNAWPF